MTSHPVTIHLPQTLYEQLQEKAQRHKRSVEVEIMEAVSISLPHDPPLPGDLQSAIEGLSFLSDDDLWQAARSHLPEEAQVELEYLNYKQQSEGLTLTEREIRDTFLHQYERYMIVRAEATALLKQRGYDISVLLTQP